MAHTRPLSLLSIAVAALLALAGAPGVSAQADPVAVAQQFFDATNRRDLASMLAVVTNDHVHEGGPCFMQTCVGKASFQEALERAGAAGLPAILTLSIRASGTTVTARNEVRPPFLPEAARAQGVERLVEIETLEIRGDKIASMRSVPDPSDPQTAKLLTLFQQGPAPAQRAPTQLPRTGAPAAPLALGVTTFGLIALAAVLRRFRRPTA